MSFWVWLIALDMMFSSEPGIIDSKAWSRGHQSWYLGLWIGWDPIVVGAGFLTRSNEAGSGTIRKTGINCCYQNKLSCLDEEILSRWPWGKWKAKSSPCLFSRLVMSVYCPLLARPTRSQPAGKRFAVIASVPWPGLVKQRDNESISGVVIACSLEFLKVILQTNKINLECALFPVDVAAVVNLHVNSTSQDLWSAFAYIICSEFICQPDPELTKTQRRMRKASQITIKIHKLAVLNWFFSFPTAIY